MNAQAIIETRVNEILALAKQRYGVMENFILNGGIIFKKNGLAAGRATWKRVNAHNFYSLEFSLEAYALNSSAMLNDTIPHEVAHLVMFATSHFQNRRIKPHGLEWKRVCMALGGTGQRCHNIPVTKARKTSRYVYELPNSGEVVLSSMVHNRIQNNTHIYRIKVTGERILKDYYLRKVEG